MGSRPTRCVWNLPIKKTLPYIQEHQNPCKQIQTRFSTFPDWVQLDYLSVKDSRQNLTMVKKQIFIHIIWKTKCTYRSSIYPAAIAKPSAADFPWPWAASKVTVLRRVLSKCSKTVLSHNRKYLPTQICLYHLITWHQIGNSKHVSKVSLPGPTYNTSLSKDQQENHHLVARPFRFFRALSASEIPSESFNNQ